MTTYLLPYTAGTVTTNGTTTVTGALTAWLANVKPGDRFRIGTSSGIVASVESNTSLTLEAAWSGSASGQSYAIDRWSRGWFSGGDLALALALYNTNRPTFIPTTGQPSDSVGADGNVAFDASANVFYKKSSGAWDNGTSIIGATGQAGEITRSGAQTGGLAKWASDTAISQATEITLSGGNVGIGTTSPSTQVHIYKASSATFAIQDDNSAYRFISTGGVNYIQSGTSLSTSAADFRITGVNGSGGAWFNIQAPSGNVGVGTTSPSTKGHVKSASSIDGLTIESLNRASLWLTASNGVTYNWLIQNGVNSTSDLQVLASASGGGTPNQSILTLRASGNVGIGTTSPSTKLHVNGPVRTASYTVATLPAAGTVGAGARAYVTDATATTFASTVAGGGANAVPVYSDGTNWKIG